MPNPHSPFDPANLYDVIADSPNQIWQAFEKTNIKVTLNGDGFLIYARLKKD